MFGYKAVQVTLPLIVRAWDLHVQIQKSQPSCLHLSRWSWTSLFAAEATLFFQGRIPLLLHLQNTWSRKSYSLPRSYCVAWQDCHGESGNLKHSQDNNRTGPSSACSLLSSMLQLHLVPPFHGQLCPLLMPLCLALSLVTFYCSSIPLQFIWVWMWQTPHLGFFKKPNICGK